MSTLTFIVQSVCKPRKTGSVVPSSRFLVKKMVAPIDFDNAKILVECGAGNGCITKELLRRMRPDARLLSFELNVKLYDLVARIEDPRFTPIHADAATMGQQLKTYNLPRPDYIVSGLPLASMPHKARVSVLEEIATVLKPGGAFIQFQYSLYSYKHLRGMFEDVDRYFTLLNIPPAVVYVCYKAHK